MSWENETITSRVEARAFLHKQITALGAGQAKPYPDKGDYWGFVAHAVQDGRPVETFRLDMNLCHGCAITRLKLADHWRGKGLGRMALKAAIGIAHERGENILDIISVKEDGPSFWPSMGAKPEREPAALHDIIRAYNYADARQIFPETRPRIEAIAELADKDPWAGWVALSQSDIKMRGGRYLKSAVFDYGWTSETMMFHLDDSATRTILQKHIGALPELPERPAAGAKPALLKDGPTL